VMPSRARIGETARRRGNAEVRRVVAEAASAASRIRGTAGAADAGGEIAVGPRRGTAGEEAIVVRLTRTRDAELSDRAGVPAEPAVLRILEHVRAGAGIRARSRVRFSAIRRRCGRRHAGAGDADVRRDAVRVRAAGIGRPPAGAGGEKHEQQACCSPRLALALPRSGEGMRSRRGRRPAPASGVRVPRLRHPVLLCEPRASRPGRVGGHQELRRHRRIVAVSRGA
jgi:hypothetical protein